MRTLLTVYAPIIVLYRGICYPCFIKCVTAQLYRNRGPGRPATEMECHGCAGHSCFIGIRDKEVYELRIVLCVLPLTEKEELEAALRDAYGTGMSREFLVVFTDRDAFIRISGTCLRYGNRFMEWSGRDGNDKKHTGI